MQNNSLTNPQRARIAVAGDSLKELSGAKLPKLALNDTAMGSFTNEAPNLCTPVPKSKDAKLSRLCFKQTRMTIGKTTNEITMTPQRVVSPRQIGRPSNTIHLPPLYNFGLKVNTETRNISRNGLGICMTENGVKTENRADLAE